MRIPNTWKVGSPCSTKSSTNHHLWIYTSYMCIYIYTSIYLQLCLMILILFQAIPQPWCICVSIQHPRRTDPGLLLGPLQFHVSGAQLATQLVAEVLLAAAVLQGCLQATLQLHARRLLAGQLLKGIHPQKMSSKHMFYKYILRYIIYIYIHSYIDISCHVMACHGVCVYACMRVCR